MIVKMNNNVLNSNEVNQYYKGLNNEELYCIYCYIESLKNKSSFNLELLSHNYHNYNQKSLLELIFESNYVVYLNKEFGNPINHEDLHILNHLLEQTYPEISYLNYLKMIKLIKYENCVMQNHEFKFMSINLTEYNNMLNHIFYKNNR